MGSGISITNWEVGHLEYYKYMCWRERLKDNSGMLKWLYVWDKNVGVDQRKITEL